MLRSTYTKALSVLLIECYELAKKHSLDGEFFDILSLTEGDDFKDKSLSRINNTINRLKDAVSNTFSSVKTSLSNILNFSKNTSSIDLSGTGEYGKVGGHYVHAKAAFSDDIKYNPKKVFSISQDFMKRNNIDHVEVTKTQRLLFKELAESGRPNTLEEHTRIAAESLRAGGASNEIIEPIINMSLENLSNQGVNKPTNIPWYK